jgi:hypothetical protein
MCDLLLAGRGEILLRDPVTQQEGCEVHSFKVV